MMILQQQEQQQQQQQQILVRGTLTSDPTVRLSKVPLG